MRKMSLRDLVIEIFQGSYFSARLIFSFAGCAARSRLFMPFLHHPLHIREAHGKESLGFLFSH